MTSDGKRLIEVSLPLKAISEQSAREKLVRHAHISSLHMWWARRPLAAMRAAIFASLVPAPDTDQEREELEDLLATIVDWDQVKDGNSLKVLEARQRILDAFSGRAPRLLDPFMGGGSTGLEALRMGCETHAVELNPAAHLIELCTLVYPQMYGQSEKRLVKQGAMEVEMEVNPLAEDVRKWGEWVLERARDELGHLYENPEGNETIVGYLWARTVTCPNPACRAEVPLVHNWWLARRAGRQIALRPPLDPLSRPISFTIVHGEKRGRDGFDPSRGTVRRGVATCLICGQETDSQYLKREGVDNRMGQRMLAVICDRAGLGKEYRPVVDGDEILFSRAEAQLGAQELDGGSAPKEPIRTGDTRMISVQLYGITRWTDLLNVRQLLAMLVFTRHIRAAYEEMLSEGEDRERSKAVATYLALAADRILDQNSSLARWNPSTETVPGAFAVQAIPMLWNYVETNPIRASSVWTASLERSIRVIQHATLAANRPATARQGTATQLPYSAGYFDAIVTDPPYYKTVPYAELSDFYYIWLKRSLGFLYPDLFPTPLSPASREITLTSPETSDLTENADQNGAAAYSQLLSTAFAEAHRVLADSGRLVVWYEYATFSSLEVLVDALSQASLEITAVWPLRTEGNVPQAGFLRRRTPAPFPIVVVCRKRITESQGTDYLRVRARARARVREILGGCSEESMAAERLFSRVVIPAFEIFSQNQPLLKADGERAGLLDLLQDVQDEVLDFVMMRELLKDDLS